MDKKIIKLVNELDLNKKSSWYKNIYATSDNSLVELKNYIDKNEMNPEE